MPRVSAYHALIVLAALAGKPCAAFPQTTDTFWLGVEGPDVLAAPAGKPRSAEFDVDGDRVCRRAGPVEPAET